MITTKTEVQMPTAKSGYDSPALKAAADQRREWVLQARRERATRAFWQLVFTRAAIVAVVVVAARAFAGWVLGR